MTDPVDETPVDETPVDETPVPPDQLADLDVDPALAAAVLEIEKHASEAGSSRSSTPPSWSPTSPSWPPRWASTTPPSAVR